MGKRLASAKATRGVAKVKTRIQSSSSNPRTTKFRSQYNSLSVIAKGGPTKKQHIKKEAKRKLAKDVAERKKILEELDDVDMIERDDTSTSTTDKKKRKNKNATGSIVSEGTKVTTASFASVWSNCTNSCLNEFFQVWNPKLNTHKDALAIIAGLSQMMSSTNTEQTDIEYARTLFKILAASETPVEVVTGSLLALTFVLRKLNASIINENFDLFYPTLKKLMDTYHESKRRTLVKSLLRCFACLTKAHPLGKDAIESSMRKKINISIRQLKVQGKIQL